MSLTLPELYDKLLGLDEITLLEILEIDSEKLIEAFKDLIDDKADKLEEMFEEDEDADE